MKKTVLSIVFVLFFAGLYASAGFEVSFNQPTSDQYELNFTLGDYELSQINIDGIPYSKILFEGSVFTNKKGFAELPFIHASVKLSANKNVSLEIIEGKYEEYSLDFPLLPSRGVIYRDQDPSTIPYEISKSSLRDNWYPQNLATQTSPYILKDIRGTNVYVYPFRYNAVQNTLRVYKSITVKLVENDSPVINPLPKNTKTVLTEMNAIYSSIFINYPDAKDDLTIGQYGDILVICTDRDEDAIQPWIDWKMEKGYNVSMEVVATNTNVKTLVQDAYDANNNLLYVQLVGDWDDIKCETLSSGSPMDPQLGCVVGSDDYADITIGRISANSPSDVTVQVDKIINYEKTPEIGGDWYAISTGIASDQGATNGDDSEIDYEHIQIIFDDKLEPFSFDSHNPIYDPSANISMVTTAVNNGTGIINYCGHGSPTSWGTTGFSNSNVSALSNGDKLPWIISVACDNGDFHTGTCFAEAWLRKSNGGAIMTLMATISQPWQPPMRGQDYFNDILTGGYNYDDHPGQNGINTTEGRTTLGAIVFNGLTLMTTESGGSDDWETAKTWTTFGDPSMQPRTEAPGSISLSSEIVMAGIPFTTTVNGPEGLFEGAMVCISNGSDYFNGVTDASGSVTIEHTLTPGTATLVATGFNLETIYQDITVASSNQAWIVVEECEVDDSNGNNNGQADYGEAVLLNVTASNVGSVDATGINAVIGTNDPYIVITDDSFSFGDIGANQNANGNGAFAITIAEDTPDGYTATIDVEFTDGNEKELWTSTMNVNLHAPVMNLDSYSIDDATGNGNEKIDPGETVEIIVQLLNEGSSDAYSVSGLLICPDPFITIDEATINYGDMAANTDSEQVYTITADANTPVGHMVTFNMDISADMGISGEGSFIEVVGHIPVCIVDLDANNNSAPAMLDAMSANGVTAEILSSIPDDLELYSSVFLCLGIYADNHVLSSGEGQEFADFLNAGGNLYMEGGDTWYYDSPTPVHPMFNINATEDGTSDLSNVLGEDGTFTEGMSFGYSGDNSYVDHLTATSPAFEILANQSPAYGTGVAYDAGTYKTIGCSHEFGGLDDGTSTKTELMAKYLEFFGIGAETLTAYFIAEETDVCENEEVQFTDYSLGAVSSWSWEFPGGDPETSTEENPVVTYTTAGTYDVTLTVSDGTNTETFTQEAYITVNVCTGIEDIANTEINIYPNPSNGVFNFEFNTTGSVQLKVVNSLGVQVYENDNFDTSNKFIDLGKLNKGMFYLIIKNDMGQIVKPLIIR
ncbi:MAG: PKD domain-containing protein [Chlorobi bacterium]|nr:PKD domain-containing protein [Chlorobiota bacterium]